MKLKSQIFLILLLSAFLHSCIFIGGSINGNGNVVEESRKTETFDKILVSRGMNVYISQGEKYKIIVKADENLMDVIKTSVENNTLKVTVTENIRHSKSKKVLVTLPEITEIKSSAGSNVFSETILTAKSLDLKSTAGSNMKLEVKAESLDVSASAGSNIKLEGTAENFDARSSAGSNIKAEELKVNNCSAHVNSGANIWISVNDNFEGKANSGGNIYYYGNPKSIDTENSSGGNIRRK